MEAPGFTGPGPQNSRCSQSTGTRGRSPGSQGPRAQTPRIRDPPGCLGTPNGGTLRVPRLGRGTQVQTPSLGLGCGVPPQQSFPLSAPVPIQLVASASLSIRERLPVPTPQDRGSGKGKRGSLFALCVGSALLGPPGHSVTPKPSLSPSILLFTLSTSLEFIFLFYIHPTPGPNLRRKQTMR